MKKSPFHEAKPRTPRAEARHRESKVRRAMEELLEIHKEQEFRERLVDHYSIVPGTQKYDQIMVIWREHQSGS